jgi:hypothetical protein
MKENRSTIAGTRNGSELHDTLFSSSRFSSMHNLILISPESSDRSVFISIDDSVTRKKTAVRNRR